MTTTLEPRARHGLSRTEYIALSSLVTATIAISIDTILPAFEDIEAEYGLGDSSLSVSLSITVFFAALGVGTLLWGPFADRYGRKPVMFVSLAGVMIGGILASVAPTFEIFLLARVFWGVAAAGPRTIILAITRDCYEGDLMSRIMSLTIAVFLIVPVIAPALGEGLIAIGSWHLTTLASSALAAIGILWFMRIEETLNQDDVMDLEFGRIAIAAKAVVSNRQTVLFTLAATMAYGSFFPWLGSSPTMINEIYGRESSFALIFGANAVLMAAGILIVERLVRRYSTYPVVRIETMALLAISALYLALSLTSDGVPPFWMWFVLVGAMTALNSSSSPLFQSLALEPMGAVAGTAASVTGATLFIGGSLLGSLIDANIDTTVTAFGAGFFFYGLVLAVAVFGARPAGELLE